MKKNHIRQSVKSVLMPVSRDKELPDRINHLDIGLFTDGEEDMSIVNIMIQFPCYSISSIIHASVFWKRKWDSKETQGITMFRSEMHPQE